jgi:hypothetical protein
MGNKSCAVCNQDCGKGKANLKSSDDIKVALCKIFCETRKEICEGKHKGKKHSQVAEDKAKTDKRLQKAASRNGGRAAVNKQRFVKYDNMPKSWNRAKVTQAALDRQLDKIEKQLKKKAGKVLATKAAKKAATAWMKFVPVLNVLSTAYDVYDFASSGVELYQDFQKARQAFSGDVYRTRPDIAIEGANGKLDSIYDFKFDGDKWQDGQRELYEKDLKDSGNSGATVNEISTTECKCDGPKTVKGVS